MESLLLNLHDYEARAQAVLPKMVFDFIAGGSGDEMTLVGESDSLRSVESACHGSCAVWRVR